MNPNVANRIFLEALDKIKGANRDNINFTMPNIAESDAKLKAWVPAFSK